MLSSDGKIHFSCNECGTKFVATTEQVGKSGKCKNCGSPIAVPTPKATQTKCTETSDSKTVAEEPTKKRVVVGGFFLLIILFCLFAYTLLTIFVIQPIGAIPKGRTLIMARMKGTLFIDSADAMCERIQGKVNILCRGLVLAQIAKNGEVYLRLPYSESLYLISTGGKKYERVRK